MGRGFWWEAKEGSGFEVKVRRESWEKGIWVEEEAGIPQLAGREVRMA